MSTIIQKCAVCKKDKSVQGKNGYWGFEEDTMVTEKRLGFKMVYCASCRNIPNFEEVLSNAFVEQLKWFEEFRKKNFPN